MSLRKTEHTLVWSDFGLLRVWIGMYAHDLSPRMDLYCHDEEQSEAAPVTTATVCIEGHRLDPGECIIKSYSENEGLLEALVDAGIVEPPHDRIPSGYVEVHVCKLLVEDEKA